MSENESSTLPETNSSSSGTQEESHTATTLQPQDEEDSQVTLSSVADDTAAHADKDSTQQNEVSSSSSSGENSRETEAGAPQSEQQADETPATSTQEQDEKDSNSNPAPQPSETTPQEQQNDEKPREQVPKPESPLTGVSNHEDSSQAHLSQQQSSTSLLSQKEPLDEDSIFAMDPSTEQQQDEKDSNSTPAPAATADPSDTLSKEQLAQVVEKAISSQEDSSFKSNSHDTIQIQVNQLEQLIESKMDRLKEDLLSQMSSMQQNQPQNEHHSSNLHTKHYKKKTVRVKMSPNHRKVAAQNVLPANLDAENPGKKKSHPFDGSSQGVHISSKLKSSAHNSHSSHKSTHHAASNHHNEHADDDSQDDNEELSPRTKDEKTKFEAIFDEALSNCYSRMRDILGLNPTQNEDEWKYADETKWLRELYLYLKEENIHLRDALAIREGQIRLLQNSIHNLSKENKEGLRTIQDLKRKMGFQNRLLKRQIQQAQIERDASPQVLIPNIVDKMKNLDASPRKFHNNHLEAPLAAPHNTPTTPTTGPSHPFGLHQKLQGGNTSFGSNSSSQRSDDIPLSGRSSLDPADFPEYPSQPSGMSPLSLSGISNIQENHQIVPRVPSARRVKNSPRLSSRSHHHPPPDTLTRNEKKQMEKLAGRLMRSLKASPSAQDKAQEVDYRVQEMLREFENRGVHLPLKRVGDTTYLLGRRKLNLSLAGKQLTVKSGGGSQPLLSILNRHLATSRNV